MKGKFITLEGVDKVGKSTQAARLAKWLRKERGVAVLETREPGGTVVGEKLRKLLLKSDAGDARLETLLMFAARCDNWQTNILPALQDGVWVVCDRFVDSTIAYQGGGRGVRREMITALNKHILGNAKPDITFYLRAPVQHVVAGSDTFEKTGKVFYRRVVAAYDKIAKEEKSRVVPINIFIDGRWSSRITVETEIRQAVNKKFFSRRVRR